MQLVILIGRRLVQKWQLESYQVFDRVIGALQPLSFSTANILVLRLPNHGWAANKASDPAKTQQKTQSARSLFILIVRLVLRFRL